MAKIIPIHQLLTKQDQARLAARLARNIKHVDNGCIVWKGAKNNDGYAKMNFRQDGAVVQVYVHRVFWTLKKRRNPPSHLVIDHKCENRACCNPNHLQLVTQKSNVQFIYRRKAA